MTTGITAIVECDVDEIEGIYYFPTLTEYSSEHEILLAVSVCEAGLALEDLELVYTFRGDVKTLAYNHRGV